MNSYLNNVTSELVKKSQNIYGNKLKTVILFGSVARGDNDEFSDIDVMLLVEMNDHELKNHRRQLLDMVFELDMKYGVLLAVVDQSSEHFEKWESVVPFYQNVRREGVLCYAA